MHGIELAMLPLSEERTYKGRYLEYVWNPILLFKEVKRRRPSYLLLLVLVS